jgi:lipid-binding SYLF domain-containing protein
VVAVKGRVRRSIAEGSTIRSDDEANKKLYGKDVNPKQIIVQGEVRTPAAGQLLDAGSVAEQYFTSARVMKSTRA